MTRIRDAGDADLAQIAEIQIASPEAAQWDGGTAAGYDVLVAEMEGRIAGFLVGRTVAEGEHEILNLAVHREQRRRGVARRLLEDWLGRHSGTVYLEVRESNEAARKLYRAMGFHEVGTRPKYYNGPLEAAIVLRLHS